MNSTTPRRHVKRKPSRRITEAERDAIHLLYAPPESHGQDDDEHDAHHTLSKTRNRKNHREEES